MAITLRQESAAGATTKGSALTYAELDSNFVHLLRQGSVTVRGDSGTDQTLGEADKDSILNLVGGTNITTAISSDSAGETVITIDASAAGLSNVVEDTTPQLGGNLDVNGNSIVSASGGNISITPDTSGNIILDGLTFPNADGTNLQVLSTNGSGTLSFRDVVEATGSELSNVVEDTTPQLGGDLDAQSNNITSLGTINTHTIPGGTGTIALTSDITFTDVVDDTTPQLGGDLDLNSSDITGTGSVDITGNVIAQSAINAQTGTTYTPVIGDASKLITLSNASAITLTIPPNASVAYPVGTKIDLAQIGAGQVTVAQGAGVTVNSTPTLKFRTQYSGATCIKTATDTWLLVGDLAES